MSPKSQPSAHRRVPRFLVAIWIAALVSPLEARSQDAVEDPHLRVQRIEVTGNERTEARIILREMETRAGMPYDSQVALMDRDRIDNLDLFSEVVVDTVRREQALVVEVRVKERLVWIPTEWIPYPVVNWSDEHGWSYGLGLTNPNASGENRSFSLLVEGGGRRQASFSYSDPWIVGNHGSAAFSLFFSESEDREGYRDRWASIRAGFGTYLGASGRARLTLDAGEIETDAWRTASGTRKDQIRSAAFALAHDTRDVYSDPRSGAYVGGSMGRTVRVAGGTVDYGSYGADLRKFWAPWEHHVWAAGVSLLYRDRPVPEYRRARLGGVSAVRGIDPVSLKGRSLLVASLEYRIALMEKRSYDFWFIRNVDLGFMIALFADAGSVWDGARVPGWDEFYGSVGGGIRILSQQVFRAEVAYSRRDGTRWIAGTGMPF